jgi:hypothetical protein
LLRALAGSCKFPSNSILLLFDNNKILY